MFGRSRLATAPTPEQYIIGVIGAMYNYTINTVQGQLGLHGLGLSASAKTETGDIFMDDNPKYNLKLMQSPTWVSWPPFFTLRTETQDQHGHF